jgi:hypothetical protein
LWSKVSLGKESATIFLKVNNCWQGFLPELYRNPEPFQIAKKSSLLDCDLNLICTHETNIETVMEPHFVVLFLKSGYDFCANVGGCQTNND